jgi:hypothetical protein
MYFRHLNPSPYHENSMDLDVEFFEAARQCKAVRGINSHRRPTFIYSLRARVANRLRRQRSPGSVYCEKGKCSIDPLEEGILALATHVLSRPKVRIFALVLQEIRSKRFGFICGIR